MTEGAPPVGELDPPYESPDYRSSALRFPRRSLLTLPAGPTELHGPSFGHHRIGPGDADLTAQHAGEAQGERIIVTGRLLDADGRPIADQLVEVWQTNAAGRYAHSNDQHPAPLDPNFTGAGRCLTGSDGTYRFVTIKPGAYPWRNHSNAWRPAHIHFSVFGRSFTERLVTQMYFPGDPLLDHDPIYQSVSSAAPQRLVSSFDLDTTIPEWALGYYFDIVIGGHLATPTEG
jgi:protocatechuate 3,4-dioxygenase, beta subunit